MLGLLAQVCGGVKGPLITTLLGEQHVQSFTLHGIVGNNYRAAAVCGWGSADVWRLAVGRAWRFALLPRERRRAVDRWPLGMAWQPCQLLADLPIRRRHPGLGDHRKRLAPVGTTAPRGSAHGAAGVVFNPRRTRACRRGGAGTIGHAGAIERRRLGACWRGVKRPI